ncbi:sec7 domain-containing protein [Cystoisospora suis]|uniref:Sec7 domain-containing protein n=1 Tax=Cystoisospora suis TaxID=483139 RepID=A0A2C6KJX4_9APIC|nr:sec7 domain-containing protein [Cystoisospora suis]
MSSQGSHRPAVGSRRFLLNSPATQPDSAARRGSADLSLSASSPEAKAEEAAEHHRDATSSTGAVPPQVCPEDPLEEKPPTPTSSDDGETIRRQARLGVSSEVVVSLPPRLPSLHPDADLVPPCPPDRPCGRTGLGRTTATGAGQQRWGGGQHQISSSSRARETPPACSEKVALPLSYTPSNEPSLSGVSSMTSFPPPLQSQQDTVSPAGPSIVAGGFLGLGTSRGALHPAWNSADRFAEGGEQRRVSQDTAVEAVPLGLWLAPPTQVGEPTWISLSSISSSSLPNVTSVLVENALVVSKGIDSSLLDLLFNQSRLLSAGAIIYFVSSLCRVSREELCAASCGPNRLEAASSDTAPAATRSGGSSRASQGSEDDSTGSTRLSALANRVLRGGVRVAEHTIGKGGEKEAKQAASKIVDPNAAASPRIFSLQKLVEVAHFNMDRIRFVWSRVWSILRHHFADACLHPCLPVRLYAIDSLRQLTTKFLEKDELAQFTFQSDFLKPFLTVMTHPETEEETKEFLIHILFNLVQCQATNIRSGWKTVLQTVHAAAQDACASLQGSSASTSGRAEIDTAAVGGGTSAAAVEKRFLLSFQVLEHILAGSLRALWQGDSLDEAVRCLLLFSSNPIDGATALKSKGHSLCSATLIKDALAIGYLEIAAIFLVEGRSDSGDGNVAAGETRRLLSALPGEQDEGLILRNIHRLHETLRMERQEAVAHLRKIRRRRRAEGESPNSRQGSRFPVNESEGNEDSKGVDCDENSKEVCPALNQLHPTEPGQTYARGTGFEESQECCGSFPSEEDSHEDERRCSERSVVEYEVTEVSSGARCSSKCKPPGSAVGPWVSAQTESDVAITDCGEPSHLSPSQSAASPQTFQSVSRSQSFSSFPRHSQGISDAFFLCVPLLTALAQLSCSPPCLSLVTTRKESFPHRVDPSGLHGSGRIRPIAALDALFRLLHTYGSHFIPLRGTRNDAFCPREGDKERGEQPPVRKGEDRARVDNHAMCGRTSHGDPPGSSIGKAAEAGRGRKEGEPQSGVFLHQECGTDESGLSVSVEKERFLWTEGWQRERGKAVWKMIFRGLLFPLFDDLFLLLHLHFQQSDVRKDRSGSLADKSKSIQSRSPRQSVIPVPAGGGKDESSPQTYNPRAGSFQVLSAPRVPEVCPSSEGGLSASKGSTPSSSLPFCDRRTSQAAPPPGDWPAASSFSYGGEVRPSDRSTRQETSIVSSVVQGGGGESILSSSGTGTITEGHELPVTGCQVSPTAGQLLKVGGERGLQRCPSKSARALLSASDSSTAAPHQKLGGESSRFLSVSLFSPSSKYSRTSFLERQESSLLICRDDTAGGGGAWIEIASWSALQQLVSLTNLHLDELQFHLDEILTLLLSAVEDENAIEGIARLGIEALSQLIRSIGPKLCRERGRGKPNGEEKDWNERDVTYSPGTDESVSEDRCIPLSHQPGMATVPGRQDGGQCTRDEFEDGVGDKEERDARVLSCRCREIPMTHTDSVTRAGEERRERGTLRVSEGREDEGGSCCRGGRRCGGKEAGQDRKEETDVVQTRADTDDDGQDVDGDACWETLATAVLMLFRRTTPVALFGSQIISAAQLEKLYGVYFGPIPLSAPFQQEVPPKVHAHGNGQSGALAVGRDKANMGGVCFSSAVYRSMGRRRFNGGRFSPDLSDPNSPSTLDGTSVSPVAPSSSSTRAFETSSEDSLPLPLRSASSVPLSSLRTSLPSGSVPCPAAPFHNDLVHDEESTAKAELDTGIPKKSNEARNARRRSVTPGNGQEGRLIPNSPGEPFPRPLRQVLLSVLPSTVMSSWGAVGGEDGHRVSEGQKQDKNNRKPTRWGGAGGSIGVLPFKPQHVVTQCIAQLLLIDILQRIIAPLAPDLSGSVLSTFLCCLETSFLFGNLFNQQVLQPLLLCAPYSFSRISGFFPSKCACCSTSFTRRCRRSIRVVLCRFVPVRAFSDSFGVSEQKGPLSQGSTSFTGSRTVLVLFRSNNFFRERESSQTQLMCGALLSGVFG